MTTMYLDIKAYKGKTYLAEITGLDHKYGLARTFVNSFHKELSRSGKTGTIAYEISDGIYESQEGTTRKYWNIAGETKTEIELQDVIQMFKSR